MVHIPINNRYNPIKKIVSKHIKKNNVTIKDKRKDKSIDLITDIFNKFSLNTHTERIIMVPKYLLHTEDNKQIILYNKPKTIDELYIDMVINCLDSITITNKKLKIRGKNGIKEIKKFK